MKTERVQINDILTDGNELAEDDLRLATGALINCQNPYYGPPTLLDGVFRDALTDTGVLVLP
jgi:hypothetical protein